MTITPEEIAAYVDGELDDAARGRITLAALADLDLAGRIAAHRALRDRLKAHYAPIIELPVPSEWEDNIRRSAAAPVASAQVISLAAVRAAQPRPVRRWSAPWASAAMAACLALGVFVGMQWHGTGPVAARHGTLVASGDLGKALDTQLASAQGDAPIRMLGTFRRAGGGMCRVFAGADASGIACRDGGQWQVQHLLPGDRQAATAYRQAGSQDATLMALAQGMAVGDPLDAEQERKAKAGAWR